MEGSSVGMLLGSWREVESSQEQVGTSSYEGRKDRGEAFGIFVTLEKVMENRVKPYSSRAKDWGNIWNNRG